MTTADEARFKPLYEALDYYWWQVWAGAPDAEALAVLRRAVDDVRGQDRVLDKLLDRIVNADCPSRMLNVVQRLKYLIAALS